MSCGCNSVITIPQTCDKNATVCQNGHVIIPISCSTPIISTPLHGEVLLHAVDSNYWLIYHHTGSTIDPDIFTYTCGSTTCTVNVEVIEGVQENQQIITLVASGECELGSPTYTWEIPPCAVLVEGYTIYDNEIQLIVNNYNPLLSLEEQICQITVNVCCGQCTGCCKCKHFYWQPPICVNTCEEVNCYCPYNCTEYNEQTSNCNPSCSLEEPNCCLSETCLELTPFIPTYQTNTSGIKFALSANLPGGVWSGALLPDISVTPENCYDGYFTNLVESVSVTLAGDYMSIYIGQVDPDTGQTTPTTVFIKYTYGAISAVMMLQVLNGIVTPLNVETLTVVSNLYSGVSYCEENCMSAPGFCAECCEDSHCTPSTECIFSPTCQNGECLCYLNGEWAEPLENGCCPQCAGNVGCQECVNGVLLPLPTCGANEVLNPTTCQCECQCSQGYCIDLLETNPSLKCKPCPSSCTSLSNQWLSCGTPLQLTCPPCHSCINNECVETPCAPGYYPSDNPCCVPCPTCSSPLQVKEFCNAIHIPEFVGCDNAKEYYLFKWHGLTILPEGNCDYNNLINYITPSNSIDITNNIGSSLTVEWNATGSVFFNPTGTSDAFVSGGFLKIKRIPTGETIPTQSLLLKGTYYGVVVGFEFKFNVLSEACQLATIIDSVLLTPINPRLYGISCTKVIGVTSSCPFTFSQLTLGSGCVMPVAYLNYSIFNNLPDDCLVTATATNQQNGTVCYSLTTTHQLYACVGGCGCAPCEGIGTFNLSIETQTSGNTIYGSSSVLVSCPNELIGLLSTCEPASGTEVCPTVNNCGSSPIELPDNYTCSNCSPFTCNTACTTQFCGWGYQESAFNLLGYNGNNIQVELLPGVLNGKLCYGINTECGYVCNCKIVETACTNTPQVDFLEFDCTTCQWKFNVTDLNGTEFETGTITNAIACTNVPLTYSISGTIVSVPATSLPFGQTCENYLNSIGAGCGSVTLTYTDNEGCTASATGTKFCQEDCTISISSEIDCEDNVIEATIIGGTPSYTVTATSNSTVIYNNIINSNSFIITNVPNTDVTIVVTDSNGCIATQFVETSCCEDPVFTATLNCTSVNNVNFTDTVTVVVVSSCEETMTASVTIVFNNGTPTQIISSSINISGTEEIEIPNYALSNITSITVEVNCGECTAEIPVALTCSGEEVFGYNCADCNLLVLNGQYATVNLCKSSCPNYGYNCEDCTNAVQGGEYLTTALCEENCNCVIPITNITIENETPVEANKYKLVCTNGVASCVQDNVNGTTTNSNCAGLTIDCSTTGGMDCVYYEEETFSTPNPVFSIFYFVKGAIEAAITTGVAKTAIITYSFRTDLGNEFNGITTGHTLNEVKAEIHNSFLQISQLFSCLFPQTTVTFVNKNGGYAEETIGNTATYGNIRIGSETNSSNFWAVCRNNSGYNPNGFTVTGDTYQQNQAIRYINFNRNSCFRLNSYLVTSNVCRSIMDNFIHEAGHALGLSHSQGAGNISCGNLGCMDGGCDTSLGGCCTPPSEVLCGCGSAACEQWTDWFSSPYYVKGIYNFYKPNSFDTFTPLITYTNDIICP